MNCLIYSHYNFNTDSFNLSLHVMEMWLVKCVYISCHVLLNNKPSVLQDRFNRLEKQCMSHKFFCFTIEWQQHEIALFPFLFGKFTDEISFLLENFCVMK